MGSAQYIVVLLLFGTLITPLSSHPLISLGAKAAQREQLNFCVLKLSTELHASLNETTCPQGVANFFTSHYFADRLDDFLQFCLGLNDECITTDHRTLRILAPQEQYERLSARADDFRVSTGRSVRLGFVEFAETLNEITFELSSNLKNFTDCWIYDPSGTSYLSAQFNVLADLTTFVAEDETLEWNDIGKFWRTVSAVYDGRIVGLPTDGDVLLLYYRKDLFSKYNVSVPQTWVEFVDLAHVWTYTDPDGDGLSEMQGACFDTCKLSNILFAILGAYMQYTGTQQGTFYDPPTMQPLFDNQGMEQALTLLVKLVSLGSRNYTCNRANTLFQDGRCLMTINTANEFKAAKAGLGYERLGVAQLPGSTLVYDRQAQVLVPCTAQLCPFSDPLIGPNCSSTDHYHGCQYVNRAPLCAPSQFGGLLGSVNAHLPLPTQYIAYQFLSFLISPKNSWEDVLDTNSSVGPFRVQHMAPENLYRWTGAGYDASCTAEFLEAVATTINHGNTVLDFRLPWTGLLPYRAVATPLYNAIVSGQAVDVKYAMRRVQDTLQGLIQNSSIPIGQIQATYYKQLGITTPPPLLAGHQAANSSSSSSAHKAASIVLAAVMVPVVVVLVVVLLWVYVRLRRGRLVVGTPGLGPLTTLLVTDIQDSTFLWETLSADAMDACLQRHHSIIRACARRFQGYESATEGDAFILAFHSPAQAMGCALQMQMLLLNADWPQELLETGPGAVVWAKRVITQQCPLAPTTLPHITTLYATPCTPYQRIGSTLSHRVWPWLLRCLRCCPRQPPLGRPSPPTSPTSITMTLHSVRASDSNIAPGARRGDMSTGDFTESALHDTWASRLEMAFYSQQPLSPTYERSSPMHSSTATSFEMQDTWGGRAWGAGSRHPSRMRNVFFTDETDQRPVNDPALERPINDPAEQAPAVEEALPRAAVWAHAVQLAAPVSESLVSQQQGVATSSDGLPPGVTVHMATGPGGPDITQAVVQGAGHVTHSDTTVMQDVAPQRSSAAVVGQAGTVGEALQLCWKEVTGAAAAAKRGQQQVEADEHVLVYRGLRVRVGIASGMSDPLGLSLNSTSGRMQYSGEAADDARAVCDAAQGGMVLLKQNSMAHISMEQFPQDMVAVMGGHMLCPTCPPFDLYQALPLALLPRLALQGAVRSRQVVSDGLLAAPLGQLVVVFMKVVGAQVLLGWNKAVAEEGLALFRSTATALLDSSAGHLVEAGEGLCLVVFEEADAALSWCLDCVAALKEAPWGEQLLSHLLCEEVTVQGLGRQVAKPLVCFRGPRIKVGVARGTVRGQLNRLTGRLTYRGRTMNWAARICSLAKAGEVLCSGDAWKQQVCGPLSVCGTSMGYHTLKGIPQPVEVYQCWRPCLYGHTTSSDTPATASTSNKTPPPTPTHSPYTSSPLPASLPTASHSGPMPCSSFLSTRTLHRTHNGAAITAQWRPSTPLSRQSPTHPTSRPHPLHVWVSHAGPSPPHLCPLCSVHAQT